MKSVAVKNKRHRSVKYVHNKGNAYAINAQNLEEYFSLYHGGPHCVTVTIVTDLNRAETYLVCDRRNILNYIYQ